MTTTFSALLPDGTTATRTSTHRTYAAVVVSVVGETRLAYETADRAAWAARADKARAKVAAAKHPTLARLAEQDLRIAEACAAYPLPVLGTQKIEGWAGTVALAEKVAHPLRAKGYEVTVVTDLATRVHGTRAKLPPRRAVSIRAPGETWGPVSFFGPLEKNTCKRR
jgi:hypothetical protein